MVDGEQHIQPSLLALQRFGWQQAEFVQPVPQFGSAGLAQRPLEASVHPFHVSFVANARENDLLLAMAGPAL